MSLQFVSFHMFLERPLLSLCCLKRDICFLVCNFKMFVFSFVIELAKTKICTNFLYFLFYNFLTYKIMRPKEIHQTHSFFKFFFI